MTSPFSVNPAICSAREVQGGPLGTREFHMARINMQLYLLRLMPEVSPFHFYYTFLSPESRSSSILDVFSFLCCCFVVVVVVFLLLLLLLLSCFCFNLLVSTLPSCTQAPDNEPKRRRLYSCCFEKSSDLLHCHSTANA